MQSEPSEEVHRLSNISNSPKLNIPHHGNPHQQLISSDLLTSFDEEPCRSEYPKNIYDDFETCAEDAILQSSHHIWRDVEKISNLSLVIPKTTIETTLLTSSAHGKSTSKPRISSKKSYGTLLNKIPNEVLTQILSYLPASSIITTSLVSKRFNALVTTPHVWRTAFSRIFQGPCIFDEDRLDTALESQGEPHSETPLFNRLTGHASWRSEYILRTTLLRCLRRGKPAWDSSKSGETSQLKNYVKNTNPVITYSSHIPATVNHIHAVFDSETKTPRFIHGSNENSSVTTSNPSNGKISKWGISGPLGQLQFTDVYTGHLLYGMDDGPAGVPNLMDVSQLYGSIVGEGLPGGRIHYQSLDELRGRYLCQSSNFADYDIGIPSIPGSSEGVSAIWIAKSRSVPNMTDGLICMLSGSTLGVVTAYSTGVDTALTQRIPKGSVTAKWVLSPGVPIIAFDVDDSFNLKRRSCNRIWAVALNALGEVFYLTSTPVANLFKTTMEENERERHAWNTGRTVYWHMVTDTLRVARDDSYNDSGVDRSYFPRSSSHNFNLSPTQYKTESIRIETYFQYMPSYFRRVYTSWDMRRRLHVDFAGDDGNEAGESIFIIQCGLTQGQHSQVKRISRMNIKRTFSEHETPSRAFLYDSSKLSSSLNSKNPESALGSKTLKGSDFNSWNKASSPNDKTNALSPVSSPLSAGHIHTTKPVTTFEEWHSTNLILKNHSKVEITSSAIDISTYALLRAEEELINTENDEFYGSSMLNTHLDISTKLPSIPGSRARFLVVGTKSGSLIVWNMRGPQSINASVANELRPLRIIYTDSPEVSCIAVSALYVVHGGSDGLVQAWNPLELKPRPIRTFHSRFLSQARRRQALSETLSPGTSFNSAGAILLDPNPARLRGMVSVGSQLRYWTYSSSVFDASPKKKSRRLPFEHCGNNNPDRFSTNGRGAIRDYITAEQEDLKREKIQENRQNAYLRGRFGVGICGLTEKEATRYAELISAEEFEKQKQLRTSVEFPSVGNSESSKGSCSNNNLIAPNTQNQKTLIDDFERDLREAIRLSLLENNPEGVESRN